MRLTTTVLITQFALRFDYSSLLSAVMICTSLANGVYKLQRSNQARNQSRAGGTYRISCAASSPTIIPSYEEGSGYYSNIGE